MKKCSKCGKVKLYSEFSKNSQTKDGMQFWCKSCHNENFIKRQLSKIRKIKNIDRGLYAELMSFPEQVNFTDILNAQIRYGYYGNQLTNTSWSIFEKKGHNKYVKRNTYKNNDIISEKKHELIQVPPLKIINQKILDLCKDEIPFENNVQKHNALESFSNNDLFSELRRRGFSGKLITKQEIEL